MKTNISRTLEVKNIITNNTIMKTYMKYLVLVLTVLGLSISSQGFAAVQILEATGFYGSQSGYHNTWSPIVSSNYGSCSTTKNGVTISGSQIQVNSTHFKIKGGNTFTISAASGYNIYRIVFKFNSACVGSKTIPGQFKNYAGYGDESTWWSQNSNWDRTDPAAATNGRSSVSFTVDDADNDVVIDNINVYTYRTATSAEASISPTYTSGSPYEVDAFDDSSPIVFTLTTNLGVTFGDVVNTYTNKVTTEADDDELEVSNVTIYDSYSNNSKITVNLDPYAKGTYACSITLGYQNSSNTASNYHMIAVGGLDFYVKVNDACSKTPTVAFNATSNGCNPEALNCSSANFTRTASVTYEGNPTTQTITYSVVDGSDDILEVNSSTGAVTLTGDVGTAMIKASVVSDGEYCNADAAYTVIVSGYSVTLHYPSCAAAVGSTLTGTSKTFSNVCGAFSLNYNMAVEGYEFCGWTTNGSFADGDAAPTPLYTGNSVDISANTNLYAVYQKHSNTFNKMPKNTTLTEGDYVLSISYDQGSNAQVMTNTLDGNKRMTVDNDSYTFTADGLTCTNDNYIWHLTPTGNSNEFTVYNAASKKYLGANNDATSSSDRQMRLEDAVAGNYQKWVIAQSGANTVPYQVKNVGRNANLGTSSGSGSTHYVGYFSAGSTIYFFKRTATSNAYTINPDCNAAEYTVTMQSAVGGTTVASATGATWSDPVLSGLHGIGSETVTITATPATGYSFTGWTVVSGGASLSPNTTTSPATFTMPAANVVIRPNFTAQTYNITYKDKDNAEFSGSPASPSPDTYTYGVGATLPEVTKSGYVFMGWFVETDCSGTRVNSISTTDYGDKTFYAKFMQLSDYRAWCPEPTVTLTGDNVYITSTNGKSVKAVNTLTLNAINLVPGSTVRLSTPASSGIMFSKSGVKYNATTATVDFTADAGGDITDETVYVHYYPTTAGSGTPADVTVTAEYQTNTDYYSTKDVHVRNMPSAFVIAAKAGGSWYALPANIASATNPASVMIDVDESSWTAKGPSTLAYELWPVKSTTGGADLYATKGEKVRFSGNSYKGLWASTSTNTLNNNAVIDAIDDTPETNYEWNVTTETDGSTWKYKLKMEGQSNFLDLHSDASGLIWGSYSANVASDELYLIPLTPIEPITMKVVEWYPTKVLVKTASDISSATVSINGTPVEKTITKKSGASCELYEISGLSTLTSNPTKTLTVSYTSGDTYSASVKIPVIIWESQNLVNPSGDPVGGYKPLNEPFASLTKEVYSYADLVVRDGATLTINGTSPQNTFYDVTIYPTSKISVPETNANAASNVFNIHSLTFFGGIDDIYDGSTYTVNKYGVPELSLKGGFGTKTVSTINYDMRVDDSQMYSLTVPYDVDLADITYWDGTSMGTLGDKLWVSAYDGQARANKDMAHTWVYEVNFESKFGEAKLKRGTGYTISADYQASMGNQTTIIRLPMKSNVAANATEAAKTVPVTAYVNTQGVTVGDNNKGWNLVGNPYMVSISGGEPGSQLVVGKLVESGTGPWDWDGTTYPYRYVTIPNDNGTDYDQMKFKDATLRPFKNFFVQIDNTTEGNALGFTLASRQDAPARFLQVAEQEVEVEILLSNDTRHDNMGLLIAEKYSPAYEINADLEKMIGSMAVYTIFGGYNLAYNALSPDDAKQFIPVGYVAPTAGEYTFSLDDESDVNEIEHIFLTDYQANVTVDLMEQDYTFTTGSGKNESRFVLNTTLKEKHETPTDIDIINSGGDLNADEPFKFIYRDKMYILRNGVMYDATGKKVKTINK